MKISNILYLAIYYVMRETLNLDILKNKQLDNHNY
jgi:hypothetical protein